MKDQLPKRKSTRLKLFDYNSIGTYFITICTANRNRILSTIDDPSEVCLTDVGKTVDKYINELDQHYESVSVDFYVIMPDHIHLLLSFNKKPDGSDKQHTILSKFVSTLKRFCNKEIGTNIWQRGSYDHVIRNKEDYDEHVKYIHENPLKWFYKKDDPADN